jgi:hypothetical protein
MMQRVIDFLRRRLGGQAPAPQIRPNELRRDVVQAERQRREARRPPAAAQRAAFDEATAPRNRPAVSPVEPVATVKPVMRALQSRSGLRQAWLMTEILGPPAALRGSRREDLES